MKNLIVGITGASSLPYSINFLQTLKNLDIRSHVIVTNGAKKVMVDENFSALEHIKSLSNFYYNDSDLGAKIASGSFITDGMIIIPCTAGSLAKIAHGFTDNLLSRSAHVMLKEKRKLILVLREDPLSRIMINNMLLAYDAGAIIMNNSPAFYHNPKSIEEIFDFTTTRILDQFGIHIDIIERWKS